MSMGENDFGRFNWRLITKRHHPMASPASWRVVRGRAWKRPRFGLGADGVEASRLRFHRRDAGATEKPGPRTARLAEMRLGSL
jgi:hypothetical protein